VKPRPIVHELEQTHLAFLLALFRSTGRSPWWIGASYRGGLATAALEDREAIGYTFPYGDHVFRILVSSYAQATQPHHWSIAENHCKNGLGNQVLLRCRERSATVVVTRSHAFPGGNDTTAFPAAARAEIARLIRPASPEIDRIIAPPTAALPQARIDPTAPSRPLAFGRVLSGLAAHVLHDTPPGVSVVRYGPAAAPYRAFVVTYKPLPYDCSISSCVPPAPLAVYGHRIESWVIGHGWLTLICAPDPTMNAANLLGPAVNRRPHRVD
jgi:hypothetical protein